MFKKIDVTDIKGFHIGNAENSDAGTGCTVIISEEGAVAGVDVRGGGPATRETDLLKSENTIDRIHAVVLSGGSAYGLEAASGVMRDLEDRGIGFRMGNIVVPIVCQASLFDLGVGRSDIRPDRTMGVRACHNAYYDGAFSNGNHGAGTGASVGKFYGMSRAMKTGLGTYACSDGNIQVGAVTALNAFADVYNGAGNIIAGLRSADGKRIEGTIRPLREQLSKNSHQISINEVAEVTSKKNYVSATPIIEEPTDSEELMYEELQEETPILETVPENDDTVDEPIESIESETPIVEQESFEVSDVVEEDVSFEEFDNPEIAEEEISDSKEDIDVPEIMEDTNSIIQETEAGYSENPEIIEAEVQEAEEEVEDESLPELSDEDMGYDITFNTTISCLITNAKLTKAQANKLASILHDGYARAIKPVHSTLDGDTIFVMCTGEKEVNFDAFAALATDILQYSVIDAAVSADDAYGLPSAKSMLNAE